MKKNAICVNLNLKNQAHLLINIALHNARGHVRNTQQNATHGLNQHCKHLRKPTIAFNPPPQFLPHHHHLSLQSPLHFRQPQQ